MNAITIKSANEIEFHFFLSEGSHSMDAKVLHSCNNEALNIINSISQMFSVSLSIETVALEEGGLKQTWKFLGKNAPQLTLIVAVATLVFTIFPPTKRHSPIETENIVLQNKKLQLEIEKLKEAKEGDIIEKKDVQEISGQHNVTISRSKFYENLLNYSKVESVDFSILDEKHQIIDTVKISNEEFPLFIKEKEGLPDEVNEDAIIILISPVLVDEKFKWKGVFNNEVIDFFMNDTKFKEEIESRNVTFQAGSILRCKLITRRKIDEAGALKITSHAVESVYEVDTDNMKHITTREKIRKAKEKYLADQMNLDFKD